MGKFGKWIGGGLGWVFGGPLGALLGFAVGSMFDEDEFEGIPKNRGNTTRGDFILSLLVLVGAVMKADGKVLRSELQHVNQFFIVNFGKDEAREAMLMLRDILKQNLNIAEIGNQIKNNLDYSSRIQLLHFLFGISKADGKVDPNEVIIIEKISYYLGITGKDYHSIKSMFIDDTDAAYRILEISSDASNEEVKKAYHKMAAKHHPDKVSYLGPEVQENAKKKFQKILDAYTKIKNERGM